MRNGKSEAPLKGFKGFKLLKISLKKKNFKENIFKES